jgi:hypothetical protein
MSSDTIAMTCQGCQEVYIFPRQENDKPFRKKKCNWCPKCEDTATEYCTEWYTREPKKKTKNIQQELFKMEPTT